MCTLNPAPGDLISSVQNHSSSNLFILPAGGFLSVFSSLPPIYLCRDRPHSNLVPSRR